MNILWRRLDEESIQTPRRRADLLAPLLACAICFGGTLLLAKAFGVRLPYLGATGAVLASTVAGGMLPGLAAMGLGLIFIVLVCQSQLGEPLLVSNVVTMLAFQLACILVGEVLRRSHMDALKQTARLRMREAHLKSIFDTLPAAMLVVDEHGIICAASTEAGRVFGYRVKDMLGTSIRGVLPSSAEPEPERQGHPPLRLSAEPVEARRLDGVEIMVRVARASAEVSGGRLFTFYVQDATDEILQGRKVAELQDELMHVARLTALGEMGAAIAHELNQPLSAAVNYLAVAQRQSASIGEGPPGPGALLGEMIDEAAREVLRAGVVLKRLRAFVSRRARDHQDVDMRDIVGEAAFLARMVLKEAQTDLSLDLGADPAWVRADRVQIQQVILNLIRNSAEAMEGAAERRVDVSVREGAEGVVVCVRDTGPGVPPLIATRLFERFNTSKPNGMGVGLAICRTIIEAHDGQIWSQAPDQGGAAFYFRLPAILSSEQAHAA